MKHTAFELASVLGGGRGDGRGGAASAPAQELRFWTTEHQPARMAKQQEMAAEFEAKTGIKVNVIPVEESDLNTRVTAAFAANDLPDVIYYTLQYVLPWSEAGILDTEAATELINALGTGRSRRAPSRWPSTKATLPAFRSTAGPR